MTTRLAATALPGGRGESARLVRDHLPHKTFDIELKELSDEGEFTLYAAVFGNVDRQGDVIEAGAFRNLAEFARDGWIALNHSNSQLPVAYPLLAEQDAHGLRVTGRFHTHPEAQDVRTVVKERMAAGKAVKCSLGYVTVDEAYEKADGRTVRRIKSLDIYEASFVNLPANPRAEVLAAKGEEVVMEAKRSVAISAANHGKLARFGEAMDGHHKAMDEAMKGVKDCHKAMKATHAEYKAFVAGHAPGGGDDEDDDAAAAEEKKPTKAVQPPPTNQAPPTREEMARRLAALPPPYRR